MLTATNVRGDNCQRQQAAESERATDQSGDGRTERFRLHALSRGKPHPCPGRPEDRPLRFLED